MQFDPKANPTKKVEPTKDSGRLNAHHIFDPTNPQTIEEKIISSKQAGTGLIKAWSASTLKNFEECRWRAYLAQVLKLPQEESEPLKRGNRIHENLELFVKGEAELSEEITKISKFRHFESDLEELRHQYGEAKVEVEGNWGFTTDWTTTGWMAPDIWARIKLDAFQWHDDTCGKVIDYKTGRKFGNEVIHSQQGMIYTIGAFMRYEQLEMLDVEFWYIDQGEKSFPQRYTRDQAMRFLPRINDRAVIMTSALEPDFVPSPSLHNCRWCPFNREKDGCDWRIGR